jgi:DNA-binding NarL/FixJ family response regulator
VRLTLIRRQKEPKVEQLAKLPVTAESYALCDRSSGAVLFRVEADARGGLPVEKAASLLAVHCLMRGQVPEDYEVMLVAKQSFLHEVAERAQQLINAGRAIEPGVRISPREHEVLDGVVQNLANKEIASRLNVSERTVKFHVSSLLAKFGVSDRIALSREVAMGRTPPKPPQAEKPSLVNFPASAEVPEETESQNESNQAVANGEKSRRRLFPMFQRERYAT